MSQIGRWAFPLLYVTFDPWLLLLGACQEVKSEAMAASYTSVFIGLEERQGRCYVWLLGGGVALPTQDALVWVVWHEGILALCGYCFQWMPVNTVGNGGP